VWVDPHTWSKMKVKNNEGDEHCTNHKFEGICIHRECVFVCMNVEKQNMQEQACTNTHTRALKKYRPPNQG
jgi:hypothetical protein